MSVIRVENVSKQYRLGMIGAGTLREDLQRWWHRTRNDAEPWKVGDVAGAGNGTGDRIWALRDVDFRIETWVRAQCRQFGTEQQRVVAPSVIERFLPEPIAHQVQLPFLAVPEGEGKHAVGS